MSDMTRGSEFLQGYPRLLREDENVPMQIPHGTDGDSWRKAKSSVPGDDDDQVGYRATEIEILKA